MSKNRSVGNYPELYKMDLICDICTFKTKNQYNMKLHIISHSKGKFGITFKNK